MSENKHGYPGNTSSEFNAVYPVYPMPVPPPRNKPSQNHGNPGAGSTNSEYNVVNPAKSMPNLALPPESGDQPSAQAPNSSHTVISFPEVIVNNPVNSDDDDLIKNFQFTNKSIRHSFIRKVYSIILVQLLITGAIIAWYMKDKHLQEIAGLNLKLFLAIPGGVYIVTFFCILCCEGPRRRIPYNYIFLLLFTVSLSMIIGLVCMRLPVKEVATAALITFGIVAALTLFAFQTKIDFTLMTGSLFVLLLVLIFYGVAVAAAFVKPLRMFYYALGILFVCLILVYDTQMIIGGKHRYGISPEEYIFAALTIYVDIMYLFIRILRLVRT